MHRIFGSSNHIVRICLSLVLGLSLVLPTTFPTQLIAQESEQNPVEIKVPNEDGGLTPPPIILSEVEITALCSSDPATLRYWTIFNPTSVEIEFLWNIQGTTQQGEVTVESGETANLVTHVLGNNVLRVRWYDENQDLQVREIPGSDDLCSNQAGPCGTELLVNGDFEAVDVSTSQKWDVFDNNTEDLGWFVQWMPEILEDAPVPASLELHRGVNGWLPQDGEQYAELDGDWGGPSSSQSGEDGSTKIYQYLTTVPGGKYMISFYSSPRPGVQDNALQFSWDGVEQDTIISNGAGKTQTEWTLHSYYLEATEDVTVIEFADQSPGNSLGTFLDNVSVKQDCVSQVTICKKNGSVEGIGLSGWEVVLKGELVDSVEVSSSGPDEHTDDSIDLPAGQYLLEASGTYEYRPSVEDGDIADAAFSLRIESDQGIASGFWGGAYQPWALSNGLGGGYAGYLGIRVNGTNFDWGSEFNPTHEYSGLYELASDGKIQFHIRDNNYSDNSGDLTVDIYPIYQGVTGQNGCVTLEDVPLGTYDLTEIDQEGWEYVSGEGEVVIDQPQETFNIVNRRDCLITPNDNQLNRVVAIDSEDCVTTITGQKWEDEDGNGIKDEGESGLEGWTIYAYDGTIDHLAANITVDSEVMTGADTNFLPAGDYVVMARGIWNNREFSTATEFFDAEFHTEDSWANHEDGTVAQGADIGDIVINDTEFVDWGAYNAENANGFEHYYYLIYHHTGGNINFSIFDGEGGVKNPAWYGDNEGGINVQLWHLLGSDVTDSDGNYSIDFVSVEQLNVWVRELHQTNWNQTFPNSSSLPASVNGGPGYNYPNLGSHNLVVPGGAHEIDDINFGNQSTDGGDGDGDGGDNDPDTYSISGKVYNDNNSQNGNLDELIENGLAAWMIYIDESTGEDANNNSFDAGEISTESNSEGNFTISNLEPGCYTVREVLKEGWLQTEPTVVDDFEYEVAVGGASCGAPADSTSLIDNVLGLFTVRTAQAQVVGGNVDDINFGNISTDDSSTTTTTTSSGSGTNRNPRVLGDSDTSSIPFQSDVLGASTELPRTGIPMHSYIIFVFLAIIAAFPVLEHKYSSK